MKKTQTLKFCGLSLAALLLGGVNSVFAQTTNVTINSFSSGTEDTAPSGGGTEWGDGNILFDNLATTPYPGTTGQAYISAGFTATSKDGSDWCLNEYICYPGDNWYYYNNSGPALVDLSQYTAIQFEILWDNADSSINIDQFNSPATIPGAAYEANSAAGLNVGWTVAVLATNYTYVTNGTVITTNQSTYFAGNGNGGYFGDYNIPDAASNGWTTMTIPIPANLNNTANTFGIVLGKWISNESSTPNPAPTAFFWVSDVQLIGSAAPPPPPTLELPKKPTPGLNVYASTAGNTFYDRQEVGLVASNGVSWVGQASAANPVTYSFTIDGFPQNASSEATASSGGCEAYMMMAPNPAAYDNAIDWNEPNCVVVELQQSTNNTTTINFQCKTNQPMENSASTTIGSLTYHGSAIGTWSITFTSETNVILTAPDNTTSSFLFTNASYFAESGTPNTPGMYLYLGMQANCAGALNQAVCYSKFSISGVGAAMSDNFLTDSTLNTNLWLNFMGNAPNGSFVMPPGAENWITWTLPSAGFQLQAATGSVVGPWKVLNGDKVVGGVGVDYQLITTNDIPAGTPNAFFDMAKP